MRFCISGPFHDSIPSGIILHMLTYFEYDLEFPEIFACAKISAVS